MKYVVTSMISALVGSFSIASAAPVTLTIEEVEARGGTLLVGLQTEDQFLKTAGIAGQLIPSPSSGTHTVSLDVPAGRYSVSVLHDVNDDQDMAVNASGMPEEGWTMYNAEQLRGAPTFELVGFDVDETGTDLTLHMIYPTADQN